MALKKKTLKEMFESCETDGLFRFKEKIDEFMIKSLLESSQENKKRVMMHNPEYESMSKNYGFLLRDCYDTQRPLIDIILLFDRVSSSNHCCANAYLCMKHKELGLSWDDLETMRTLRNEVSYEGKRIDEMIWLKILSKFEVSIVILEKAVKGFIMEHFGQQ